MKVYSKCAECMNEKLFPSKLTDERQPYTEETNIWYIKDLNMSER